MGKAQLANKRVKLLTYPYIGKLSITWTSAEMGLLQRKFVSSDVKIVKVEYKRGNIRRSKRINIL